MPIPPESVRNFCIIAHIDHGKSTLADRFIELSHSVDSRVMKEQVLDDMEIERERGITIKSHAISLPYHHDDGVLYHLNLVDPPGQCVGAGLVRQVGFQDDGLNSMLFL